MSIFEVRVTPEVARLRQGDAGTRNVAVVHRFSRHPTLFVGELPPELRDDSGLEVRELAGKEARLALGQGALVSAQDCHTERLARLLAGIVGPAEPAAALAAGAGPDLRSRVEALERTVAELRGEEEPGDEPDDRFARLPELTRPELDELHEELLGKKPHGNARDESVRDAIRQALEGDGDDGKE